MNIRSTKSTLTDMSIFPYIVRVASGVCDTSCLNVSKGLVIDHSGNLMEKSFLNPSELIAENSINDEAVILSKNELQREINRTVPFFPFNFIFTVELIFTFVMILY